MSSLQALGHKVLHLPELKVEVGFEKAVTFTVFSILIALLMAIGYNSVTFDGQYSPDSLIYRSAADNILAGRGFSVSMTRLDWAVIDKSIPPTPVMSYSPGYPLLIAIMGDKGELLIPVLFLGVFLSIAYLAIKKHFGWQSAVLSIGLLLMYRPLIDATYHAWSETLGLTFVALFLLCLTKDRREKIPAILLVLCGMAVGLGYWSRYAILPLAPLGLCLLVDTRWEKASIINTTRRWALFLLGLAPLFGVIMGRNYYYRGSLMGGIEVQNGPPLLSVLTDLLVSFRSLIPSVIVIVVLIAGAMVIAALVRKKPSQTKEKGGSVFSNGVIFLVAWPLFYLTFLIYAEFKVPIDVIGDRLTLPAFVVLVIGAAVVIGKISDRRLVAVASLILVIWASLSHFNRAQMAYSVLSHRGIAKEKFLDPHLEWIKDNTDSADIIIAEDGFAIPFQTGAISPVLYFSGNLSDQEVVSSGKLASLLGKYPGRRVFLVLKGKESQQLTNLRVSLIAKFDDGWGVFQTEDSKSLIMAGDIQ